MGSFKYKFLIIIVLLVSSNIYTQGLEGIEGIWRCKNSINSNDDSYIAINKVKENECFVLFVSPYWEHQLDYSEYGELTSEGYIVIKTDESIFYIEVESSGYLYHYWNSLDDQQPSRYEKILDKETMMTRDDNSRKINSEDFFNFIKSQEEDSGGKK
jgi:hypothetical protein